MSEGQTEPTNTDPQNKAPEPKTEPTNPVQTFSQDDLNRIAAREKEEGKRTAEKALVDQLGVSLEEAKAIIKAKSDADQALLTETEKAAQKARADQQAAEAKLAESNKILLSAKIAMALSKKGIKPEDLGEVSLMVQVPDDADETAIATKVDDLATRFPALFSTQGNTQTQPQIPSSNPPGTPPAPSSMDSAFKMGQERAKSMAAQRGGLPTLGTPRK